MKGKILIVDDESEIRDMLTRHLMFNDYEILQAGDGREALEVLEENKIDVIISDIVMPRMSGVDMLAIISDEYPMTRCIMMTGYVTQMHLLKCMHYHAETVIYKPIENLQEVDDAVEGAFASIKRWNDKLKVLKGMKT